MRFIVDSCNSFQNDADEPDAGLPCSSLDILQDYRAPGARRQSAADGPISAAESGAIIRGDSPYLVGHCPRYCERPPLADNQPF